MLYAKGKVQRESVCLAPSGLYFAQGLTQGFGRCASSPWAVLSRAFSAYGYICDQTCVNPLIMRDHHAQKIALLPLRYPMVEALKARDSTAQGGAKRNPGCGF
jgi:hypothetical protein